uniref:Uncharacterized protein n=1 Tax=Lactuca sativa TaxID=4236 RepID=A0A9R1W331_LACSA|nr:hypothetical protein LSAT_V11C300127290 [Lactuca sativa]
MDPNQNTPPNYRNPKPDNTFALNTTHRQFPTTESPQGGFINLLQTVPTFSVFPTTTNFTTIPTISTTPTTIITTTTTTKLITTTFAGFCCRNATFTTTSTKKELRKKISPTHYRPRKGPMDKRRRRKVSGGMGGASEDPIVGDSHPYGCFWEKVQTIF